MQFTRQTAGLAGALKKIGGIERRLASSANAATPRKSATCCSATASASRGLFATHPPLIERIQALEPQFSAEQLDALQRRWIAHAAERAGRRRALGLAEGGDARVAGRGRAQFEVTPPMVVAQVARPAADDYRRADAIADSIPDELRALAAQRDAVMPLLFGLLLDDDAAVATLQREEIAARLGQAMAPSTPRTLHRNARRACIPLLRLPLAALAFPVLRLRPRPELDVFLDTVHAMVHADGQVSLFEYCLGRLLQVQVRESLDPARACALRPPASCRDVRSEIATLLCVVAQCGNDERRARAARLPRRHPARAAARPPAVRAAQRTACWRSTRSGRRWTRSIRWPSKRWSKAITATISHDGRVSVAEAELLRTICGALHCPLPPMLERSSGA